jgi:two-component system, OmpR family, phosphate regulon sensor histidine kinase PhoR
MAAETQTLPAISLDTLRQLLDEQQREVQTLRALLDGREKLISQLQSYIDNETTLEAPKQSTSNGDYKLALALTLANSAYDALLVVDAEQKIIAINDSAEVLFERSRPIGEQLVDVTNAPELEMMVADALEYQEETFEEQVNIERRTYRVRCRVIQREGNQFIGLALQDISELVRLNRARRDMVANISHELRTPIANIRLSIDSLFHEQDKPKRKASITALKDIARETDSLLWLVQELYDLSMIESGQAIMRLQETPLVTIVQEALERMEDLGSEKELHLIHAVPDDMIVLADRDQVRRVLLNLIHNAIKFSPPKGKILITAAPQGEDVVVSVTDDGLGVNEDYVERIFERFYQVDSARSGGEGTGLGLAICKHIVEAHDGRIWAESNRLQSGGHFHFTLPLAETAPLS